MEILNFGKGGSGTDIQYLIYRELGDRYGGAFRPSSSARAAAQAGRGKYMRIDEGRRNGEFSLMSIKSSQLQIRVTPRQKAELKRLADGAGLDVSSYVLERALPEGRMRFGEVVQALHEAEDHRFPLAALHDLLGGLTGPELADAVAIAPEKLRDLPPLSRNYVAAMVEQASNERGISPPTWAREIPPLAEPHFTTPLRSLRLHLLRSAPVPFKRRNIFVDSGVGARV